MRWLKVFISRGETPPEKIGRKALARGLSDIAAMAGTPTAALVTMGLPEKFDAEFITRIYDGLNALAREHGVAIVGGETDDKSREHFDFRFAARNRAARESRFYVQVQKQATQFL